jgi:hypothetical protein
MWTERNIAETKTKQKPSGPVGVFKILLLSLTEMAEDSGQNSGPGLMSVNCDVWNTISEKKYRSAVYEPWMGLCGRHQTPCTFTLAGAATRAQLCQQLPKSIFVSLSNSTR